MRQVMVALLLVGVAFASPAWPQTTAGDPATVGDLLARGGKRLAKEELVNFMSGATLSGGQFNRLDWTFENEMKEDGTVSGVARNRAEQVTFTGTWSIDEQGTMCMDLRNSRGQKLQLFCSIFFLLDASYFAVPAPAVDKTAQLYRRTFKQ